MNTSGIWFFRLGAACAVAWWPRGVSAADAPSSLGAVVKRVEINPAQPVFVPVHPRIATTIRFPRPIGQPMGTGFIESDVLQSAQAEGRAVGGRGEYVITYAQGDAFFTVQPMQRSELLNLNVPYEGTILVLFFYPVEQPLCALASLSFEEPSRAVGRAGRDAAEAPAAQRSTGIDGIQRVDTAPTRTGAAASPARLAGFLRKLKLVHAARRGPELDDLASAMKLRVAVSAAEDTASAEIPHPVTRTDAFELILLRAVRDPEIDAVGFVVLFRNTSPRDLVFDLRTLSARCGAALYTARVVDAPASLKPGEILPGYFVIVGSEDDRPGHLSPDNDWRLSVARLETPAAAADSNPSREEKGRTP